MAAILSGARHTAAPSSLNVLRAAVHAALFGMLGAALPAVAQDAPAQSALELSEILVKARRDDVASSRNGSSVVIGAEQLQQNNAIDMASIARYSPLISVPSSASGSGNIWDGAGNTSFNIRGVEGNRVSLELDGMTGCTPGSELKTGHGLYRSSRYGRVRVQFRALTPAFFSR